MLSIAGNHLWSVAVLAGAVMLQTACGAGAPAATAQPTVAAPTNTVAAALPTQTAPASAVPTSAPANPTVVPADTATALPTATPEPATATQLAQPTAQPATSTALPTTAPSAVPTLAATRVPATNPPPPATAVPTPVPQPSAAPAPQSANANGGSTYSEKNLSLTPEFARALPVRLKIPAIGVDAPVESVGKSATDAMANPERWEDVGWYNLGAHAGEFGTAVMAGHLDSTTGPAVFWRLGELKAGDKLSVVDAGGKTYTYMVESTALYPYDKAPLHEIFDNLFAPRLNLITCHGQFDRNSKNYNQRYVVYTRLVSG